MKTGRLKTEVGVIVRSKFSLKSLLVFSFLVIFVLLSVSSPASAAEPVDIPIQLKPWKQWVLHDMAERLCPTNYNQENVYQCVWPSRLELFVKPVEGRFEQHLLVFAKSWVSLPGGAATVADGGETGGSRGPGDESQRYSCHRSSGRRACHQWFILPGGKCPK